MESRLIDGSNILVKILLWMNDNEIKAIASSCSTIMRTIEKVCHNQIYWRQRVEMEIPYLDLPPPGFNLDSYMKQ
jgi:hypothetical protein